MANEYEKRDLKSFIVKDKDKVKLWLTEKNEENLNNIILQYHYFVKSIVGKLIKNYNNKNLFDDFLQDAQIPLIKTYWDYDVNKGADFTTILKIRIEGYIQQMYNDNYRVIATPKHAFKEKKIKSMSILNNDYLDINDKSLNHHSYLYEINDDSTNDINRIMKKILPERKYFILSEHYGFNMKTKKSLKQLSETLKCSVYFIKQEIEEAKQLIAENKNKFMEEF